MKVWSNTIKASNDALLQGHVAAELGRHAAELYSKTVSSYQSYVAIHV
jgi:hypothetical protein